MQGWLSSSSALWGDQQYIPGGAQPWNWPVGERAGAAGASAAAIIAGEASTGQWVVCFAALQTSPSSLLLFPYLPTLPPFATSRSAWGHCRQFKFARPKIQLATCFPSSAAEQGVAGANGGCRGQRGIQPRWRFKGHAVLERNGEVIFSDSLVAPSNLHLAACGMKAHVLLEPALALTGSRKARPFLMLPPVANPFGPTCPMDQPPCPPP